jgi:hypothetical protein
MKKQKITTAKTVKKEIKQHKTKKKKKK